jgi:hypothetical protein
VKRRDLHALLGTQWGTHIGDRQLSGQDGDLLQLDAQLEMQVEQDEQADNDPDVEHEIDAAPDADESCNPCRMGRYPDEIERGSCSQHG